MSPLLAPALVAAVASLAPQPDPAELVRRLGAPDYRDREAAGKALRLFQCAAEPAVRAGAIDPNPEVARRAADVLRLRRLDAEWRATAGTDDRPTPAWKAFRGIAGDTLESRTLYRELTAGDRYGRLAEAVANPDAAAIGYAAEADRLEAAFEKVIPRRGCGFWPNRRENALAAAPREDVLLALFLGSLPHPPGAADPGHTRALLDEGFRDLVGGGRKAPARALFDAWLGRRRDPEALADGLYAALHLGIREAAPAARRVLADPAADPRPVGYALLVLGNHGDPAGDRPRLARFRDDARVYQRWSGGGHRYTIQVRDVAAGMLLIGAGADAKAYGFESVHRTGHAADPGWAPYWEAGWFHAEADRAAAHQKAWAWLDKQPGPGKK